LANLCFIDEREDALTHRLDTLHQKGIATNARVFGAFHTVFDYDSIEIKKLYHEATSIYAEVAWVLGYLTIERTLSKQEWKHLRQGLRTKCKSRDWFQSEIREQFGEPSLKIHNVYCYVSELSQEGWVFFDFHTEHWEEKTKAGVTVHTKYRDNPILRNVRLPVSTLRRGIVFTPYGRQFSYRK
ncbi:MAG: hypothetical protein AAF639_20315, partial [Chloroflexota bacterium]